MKVKSEAYSLLKFFALDFITIQMSNFYCDAAEFSTLIGQMFLGCCFYSNRSHGDTEGMLREHEKLWNCFSVRCVISVLVNCLQCQSYVFSLIIKNCCHVRKINHCGTRCYVGKQSSSCWLLAANYHPVVNFLFPFPNASVELLVCEWRH